MFKYLSIFCLLFILSCSTTPTGRKQLKLLSSTKMANLGDESFSKIKTETPTTKKSSKKQYIECISKNVLKSIGENANQWEIQVFESEKLNAFALPGKNIGIYTGMIDFAKDQDQIAAIIGHEIAHVIADHGNERLSQQLVIQAGMQVADVIIEGDDKKSKNIMALIGAGTQVGILLPFSRKHESEADQLGIQYMAKAGFDPSGAVKLWQKMKKNSGKSVPEFMSTHPSNDTRIKKLQTFLAQNQEIYKSSTKVNCSN